MYFVKIEEQQQQQLKFNQLSPKLLVYFKKLP